MLNDFRGFAFTTLWSSLCSFRSVQVLVSVQSGKSLARFVLLNGKCDTELDVRTDMTTTKMRYLKLEKPGSATLEVITS